MTLFTALPLLAGVIFVVVALTVMGRDGAPKNNSWMVPALLCAIFSAWSVVAVIQEGPLGFWPVHTYNMWGNQVWFDLLFALGIGWFLIVPKAKAVGMRLPLWLLFIMCSGSIGLSAMLARYLYLKQKA